MGLVVPHRITSAQLDMYDVALALEASKSLISGQNVQLIELENISTGKAIKLKEPGLGPRFCSL